MLQEPDQPQQLRRAQQSQEWVSPQYVAERGTNLVFLHSFDQIDQTLIPRIGGKGANLVELRQSGLPVPAGYCVTTDVHDYYNQYGKLPDGLVNEVAEVKKSLGGKVAIRSSANLEDGSELSMAGVFESRYVYDDMNIADAIERILAQSRSEEVAQFMRLHGRSVDEIKMGLVIQELIVPEAAGVVYTGVNRSSILIQYVDDFGATLVGGETQGSAIVVNKDGEITESSGFETRPMSQSAIHQIIQLSHAIESLFPGIPQDIEFAYRDGTVYIVQARTLTADLGKVDLKETPETVLEVTKRRLRQLIAEEKRELGTPTAIFSDANYSELLPKPTEMDIGIHMYVWGGSDGIPGAKQLGHSAMGYLVGDEASPIISYIGGRTYFSIARNAGVYHIGFPETKEEYFSTLVCEYLDAVQNDPKRGSYPQMGLYLQDPTLEDLQIRYGERAVEYFQVYQAFVARMRGFADGYLSEFYTTRLPETTRFVEQIQQVDLNGMTNEQLASHAIEILEHNRTKSYVDFVKGARLGFYYSQRLQSLLREKLGVENDEAQRMYSRLTQGLDGSAITDANIAIAEAESEEESMHIAQALIGHFSTGEMLEISHKPMRDDKDRLHAYVRGIRQTGQYSADFEKQKAARIAVKQTILASVSEEDRKELETVIQASQTYMAVRETAKYHLTKEYLPLRDTLELLGERVGLESGDIYYLYPRELPHFAADPQSMLHLIRSRKQAFKNYEKLDLPPVIRESDIETLGFSEADDFDFTEVTGNFLAEGPTVVGVIVNIDEFEDLEQINTVIQRYEEQGILVILAATQLNLSHDPIISQSAGLVIKNAGIVAHGAQRARELGKGAIGGINTKNLKTGTEILFDPESRSLKKVDKKVDE